MATQVSLNDGAVASAGALAIQTNGTTQAVSISTGQVATLAQNPILTSGTANGVAYLNGSKAVTSGSALVFDSSDRLIVGAGSAVIGNRMEITTTSSGQSIGIRGRASDAIGILSWHANAASTEYARIQSDNTSALIFGTGSSGTEGFRLTNTSLYTASTINVGIGTSSPGYKLDVLGNVNRFAGSNVDGIFLSSVAATDTSYYGANYYNNNGTEGVNASGRASWRIATLTAGSPTFSIGYRAASAGAGTFSTPLTIDSSGNLLVGTTTSPSGVGRLAVGEGAWLPNTGYFQLTPKYTSGTGSYYFYDTTSGFFSLPDNANPLGNASYRWTTVYATTALINTSDASTKQQIRSLNDAEKLVAQSIKGLIKAYKFNDSVAEKGDGARIHIGVIAQDVQAAFVAEGLDSNKYSMFCSDTWYEVDGQARSEESGFYTKDTPNAVEVTRLGIRYDELLAFVISTL